MSEEKRYACPVCAYGGLWEDPLLRRYNICPQCGVEFGNDDFDTPHAVLRERWIAAGRPYWQTEVRISQQWGKWYDLQMHPDTLEALP